jgi:hypothetical protein
MFLCLVLSLVLSRLVSPCLVSYQDRRGQTGMLLIAGEQSRLMTYFVPQLGPAPRWCSFLEGLTEELEEAVRDCVQLTIVQHVMCSCSVSSVLQCVGSPKCI